VDVEGRVSGKFWCLVGGVADEILAADQQHVAAEFQLVGHGIIDAGLDPMAGDRGNLIAGLDKDVAIAVGKGAVRAKRQSIAKSRIDEGIARIELEGAGLQVGPGLDALATRRADILEIAEALHLTWNREDVVRVVRAVHTELPFKRTDVQISGAAQAGFDGMGHDLLQRRIGNQECGNDAGLRRIGATEFQGGRRPVGFGIAGIGGQSCREFVGTSDNWVEARVCVTSVQRRSDLVLQIDIGDIEATAASEGKCVGNVEGVEGIEPVILIGGAERDRADRNRVAGLAEKYSAAADDIVRADSAEFGARLEAGHAVIETGSDHEMIVVAEQMIGIGRLQRQARRCRMRRGSIVFSQYGIGIEGIGELSPIQAVCRCDAIAITKQRRICGTGLGAGRIAILGILIENPDMSDAFDGPGRRDLDLTGQIDIAHAIR